MQLIQFLASLATLIAACVAVYGIFKWRAEHRGAKQIDLAEETLELFYRAVDALASIRNPGSFSHETEGVEQAENERAEDFEARRRASIVFKRFQHEQETFSRIHALRYRFMAVFGKDSIKPFDEIFAIVWEIKRSAMSLGRLWARQRFATEEQEAAHRKEVDKYEAIFWSGLPDDPLEARISDCIKDIERRCRHIVEYGVTYRSDAGDA